MKKLIKIVLILGGVIIGGYTIAALLAVLSKREEDDDDVEYCNYDDLECMPGVNGVSLSDDIDIDVE
jgi:hypothetical protein